MHRRCWCTYANTATGRLYLPDEKLARLRRDIDHWLQCKACRRRELESLVGTLQHAAKVIHPGRSFVQRAIDLLKGARRPYHYIRLNQQFRPDLQWWKTLVRSWNGIAYFSPLAIQALGTYVYRAVGHGGKTGGGNSNGHKSSSRE